jgi:predicted alpha/beta superfamily hydrolase
MHDGQNVFDGMTSFLPNLEWRADETAEMLINAKLMEPVIIVAIDNGGTARGDEYLPTSTRLGNSVVGGKADTYGDFLDKEVMPMINAKYRTKTGAENTGLIGSSFGGVITCYLTATRPNTYGKAAIVSPSVWVDNKVLLKYVGKFNGKKPKIWIDMGTHEGPNAVAEARELYDAYLKRGFIPGKDIQFTIEPNAEHNEVAWARRLPSIYTFLFGKK